MRAFAFSSTITSAVLAGTPALSSWVFRSLSDRNRAAPAHRAGTGRRWPGPGAHVVGLLLDGRGWGGRRPGGGARRSRKDNAPRMAPWEAFRWRVTVVKLGAWWQSLTWSSAMEVEPAEAVFTGPHHPRTKAVFHAVPSPCRAVAPPPAPEQIRPEGENLPPPTRRTAAFSYARPFRCHVAVSEPQKSSAMNPPDPGGSQ
jgi:hypothetical protein